MRSRSRDTLQSPKPSTTSMPSLASLFTRAAVSARRLRQLHAQLLLRGLAPSSVPLSSRLVASYLALALPSDAQLLFDQLPQHTPHAYNTLLSGLSRLRLFPSVLSLYKTSIAHSLGPDSFSLSFAIHACTGLHVLGSGTAVHAQGIRAGLDTSVFVSHPLMELYIELGSVQDVEKLFKCAVTNDPAAWGLLMKCYSRAAMDSKVLELLGGMKLSGVNVDACAAVFLALAYGNAHAARQGRAVHALCLKANHLGSNIFVQTSLVDMYVKSGFIDLAYHLFYDMPVKDVVSWSSMVVGLAQCGKGYEALRVFKNMLQVSVRPNKVTLSAVFLACAHLGALLQGKSAHGFLFRMDLEPDVVTNTALVDMYAKCGSLNLAYKLFSLMPERNVFSWSAMIGGFGLHGNCSQALALFEDMKSEGVAPNAVTFVAALSACSHSGQVKEGRQYFESMMNEYSIAPTTEHYSCMVDLLGRAGLLEEAESLVREMPVEPSASVWGALLIACRVHKRVELAEEVSSKLFVLEPGQTGVCVSLANVYAAADMWEMVRKTREMLRNKGAARKKMFGFSTIEVDKRVYIFDVIDQVGGLDPRLSNVWEKLSSRMEALGYTPDLTFTVCDMEGEGKGEVLCGHSEKLAMAFGLLRTSEGTPLHITKSMRVCRDCHTTAKLVSLITKREIIIRDSKRFHHIKGGACSCGDYW